MGRLRSRAATWTSGRSVCRQRPLRRRPAAVLPARPEGKVVKNRLDLDVRVGSRLVGDERLAVLEAECARLVALGAVRVQLLLAAGVNELCLVMQDVEGIEFCLD